MRVESFKGYLAGVQTYEAEARGGVTGVGLELCLKAVNALEDEKPVLRIEAGEIPGLELPEGYEVHVVRVDPSES